MSREVNVEIVKFKWVTIHGTHVNVSGSSATEGHGFDFSLLRGGAESNNLNKDSHDRK